jgi:hypothetical protein
MFPPGKLRPSKAHYLAGKSANQTDDFGTIGVLTGNPCFPGTSGDADGSDRPTLRLCDAEDD